MKKLIFLFLIAWFSLSDNSRGQTVDDFNYSGKLNANGWSTHSGTGTNEISTTTGLTFTGYPNSGLGNAALVGNLGGEDVNFTAGVGPYNTNGATVYFSFMLKVTESANKSGDYFIHIGNRTSVISFSSFCARVFAKTTSSGVNFGISNTSTGAYGTTNYLTNTTYLLVVKYTINTAGDDRADLWVFPTSIPASESDAGVPEFSSTTSGQDIVNSIALRQGTTSQPQTVVDGIRMATTWTTLLPPATPALTAPVATAATNISSTSFTANWGASANVTSYKIDVSASSDFSSLLANYSNKDVGNVTAANISSLTPSTTYYYRVRASNSTSTSGNSNSITVTTMSSVTPSVPLAAPATNISSTGFTANWSSSANASSYKIDVSGSSNFSTLLSGYNDKDVGNVTSANISGLDPGSVYYYRVRAASGETASQSSNTISVTCLMAPPAALPATNVTTTGFTAAWNASTNATSYKIDVSVSSDFSSLLTNYNNLDLGNVTSVSISSLIPGGIYYYRVRAANNNVTSTSSNSISVNLLMAPPIALPAANITTTGFTAKWNSSANAVSYKIDVSTKNDFSSLLTGYNNKDVGKDTSATISSLSPGTTYYYRARSSNVIYTSDNSNTITVITQNLPIPAAPVAKDASNITTSGFTANWNPSAGAEYYLIDIATDAGFTNILPNYNSKSVGLITLLNITGLGPSAQHYYRIRASNSGGTSPNSNTISVVTLLMAPVATTATGVTKDGFTANWNASSNASNYWLDVSTVSDFSTFIAGYENKNAGILTSLNVSSLSANTTYYYRVSASNSFGASPYSNTISVTTSLTGLYDVYSGIPEKYEMYQNYPNPFNPSTNIRYALPENSSVKIYIIDILGRVVNSFNFNSQSAGYHSVRWNGDNYSGQQVSGGVYIYTIHAKSITGGKGFNKSAKLILMK
ncbi:MAG: hypothetical protein CVV24_00305 [Ignavibacteriae bacterium HGW-Ignavibacteriae-3]|nr:MAG: hypothetical protein CVV24_00305 [Ignavibacteriae bacterium HGW-Ignavibacteriae-3]